ncbi:hypothetical protein PanWU01x14_109550 [Parasponia andersonii]|uniref:Uncharacterized protein n=1 Tax=Parasponia andersonii TaxID=3476 RepID=A0A2P5CZS3_PARAD|nr:hypothetical protein PanWU01x14_109550 [Parasponia andersonii]
MEKGHEIKSYADATADQALIRQLQTWMGPAHFSLLGPTGLDCAVASQVYEILATKLNRR